MACERLSNFVLLPELKLVKTINLNGKGVLFVAQKESEMEVCPKCATPSYKIYDRRKVVIKDEPLRGKRVLLEITKRTFISHLSSFLRKLVTLKTSFVMYDNGVIIKGHFGNLRVSRSSFILDKSKHLQFIAIPKHSALLSANHLS